ncbi:MAG: glycosyltransferase family 4 protein [Candidatus Helarchaeota archaeon]
MNIILSHYPVTISGGAERSTLDIGFVLSQAGHKVYLWGPWSNYNYYLDIAKKHGLNIIPYKPCSYFREIRSLRSACLKYKIDLIISSSRRFNLISYLATIYISTKNIPVLRGLISTWDAHRLINKVASILLIVARFTWKIVLRLSPLIICCSNAVANDAQNQLRCSSSKFIVIYNGILIPRIDINISNVRNKPKSPFKLLLVGRLHPEKRIDLVIPLMNEILKFDKDVYIDIAGDGDLRNELQELIRFRKMDNHIKLLGHCENITKYYQNSHVLIHFRNDEGFGRIYLEAQMNFLPVVCIRGGAASEVVREGITGYLHELSDIRGMAQSILRLKNDSLKYEEMSKCARAWAESNFTMDAMKHQYDNLIRQIMNKN